MGVQPVLIRVMTSISGVGWDEAWNGRTVVPCGSPDLPLIGRREFIANKCAAGRLKALADIQAIGEAAGS